MSEEPAIELVDVVKSFRKTARRREYTTLKTELVRLFTGARRAERPAGGDELIRALSGVNLRVPRGATVGVIGRNGSGKSTLLKLLTGIYTPTSGRVTVRGRVSALLELGAGFHPDFTGRENILINGIILGMSRAQVKARVDQIIEFAELGPFIDEPVRTYSSGMFMRLAFAVATHVDPDILVIDEILSVGDEHFARKSRAVMDGFRAAGKTLVLVTHELATVAGWCDLAAWIDGGVVRQLGPPAEVVAAYQQAVRLAEQQAAESGHSALDAPGLALPAPPPVPEPRSDLRVRSLRGPGAPLTVDGALELTLDFEVPRPGPCSLEVAVRAGDGQVLFTTSHASASAGTTGSARLEVPRHGLAPGTYRAEARVSVAGTTSDMVSTELVVAPGAGAEACPAHTWSMLGPSA